MSIIIKSINNAVRKNKKVEECEASKFLGYVEGIGKEWLLCGAEHRMRVDQCVGNAEA